MRIYKPLLFAVLSLSVAFSSPAAEKNERPELKLDRPMPTISRKSVTHNPDAKPMDFYKTNGNMTNQSFSKAKKMLETQVYYDHRESIYCGMPFDEHKNVLEYPKNFPNSKNRNRMRKIEWEHAVPAENFGNIFIEWRAGHRDCTQYGRPFKGRRCAEKVNPNYRFMQADMYNLFPAIGSVNAARSNKQYSALPWVKESSFGECMIRIEGKRFEPPDAAKGELARAGLYMAWAYPQYTLSRQQRQLFEAWNRQYPASDWECTRYQRIRKLQKNDNPFLRDACAGRIKGE